jgi:RHS repeat-associated protein
VHDQVGSTLLLLAADGTVAGGYSYTPYGLAAHTGTATTPLQFTGQYTDAETGLVYMRARYYDPATAEFLTVDPLVSRTRLPYAYADDSPLDNSDPSGDSAMAGGGYRPGNQNPAQLSPKSRKPSAMRKRACRTTRRRTRAHSKRSSRHRNTRDSATSRSGPVIARATSSRPR